MKTTLEEYPKKILIFIQGCWVRLWRQRQNLKPKHYIFGGVAAFLLFCLVLASFFIFSNNVQKQEDIIKIRKGDTYEAILDTLANKQVLKNEFSFRICAQILGYPKAIKPGRYKIERGMSNASILYTLLKGKQEPLRLVFLPTRTIQDLALKIAKPFEMNKDSLLYEMLNPTLLDSLNANPQTAIALYIPNTYEIYWTITPKELVRKLINEYKKFWTADRIIKAKALQLTPIEVSILASIVQAESYKKEEYPRIAGVYINRLQKNDKLRADPTVIYAIGDYSIRRVLTKHTLYDSPYNTYVYTGLPPGPINCPSISALEGVLNYEKHNYYFFCARDDFSGYHDFSVTWEEHKQKAREYRKALDSLNPKND
jgi:UPF0755 protein